MNQQKDSQKTQIVQQKNLRTPKKNSRKERALPQKERNFSFDFQQHGTADEHGWTMPSDDDHASFRNPGLADPRPDPGVQSRQYTASSTYQQAGPIPQPHRTHTPEGGNGPDPTAPHTPRGRVQHKTRPHTPLKWHRHPQPANPRHGTTKEAIRVQTAREGWHGSKRQRKRRTTIEKANTQQRSLCTRR